MGSVWHIAPAKRFAFVSLSAASMRWEFHELQSVLAMQLSKELSWR